MCMETASMIANQSKKTDYIFIKNVVALNILFDLLKLNRTRFLTKGATTKRNNHMYSRDV